MLPRKNRVDKKGIDLIFKEGKSVASPNLTFKFIKTGKNFSPRTSFIAPKSVAKLAVMRNKLRRLGYRALTRHIKNFPSGLMGAFVFKIRPTEQSPGREYQTIIEDEIKNILNKIN